MRLWETASIGFFAYLALIAPTALRAGRTRLIRLYAGAAAGLTLAFISANLQHRIVLHDVLLPPLLLLLGYWTSGLLFVAPRASQERLLMSLDRRAGVARLVGRLPRVVAELFELAYLGVYPLIPIALFLHAAFAAQPDAEEFWAVILITDFLCFGTMPFVQTRPPRVLEGGVHWSSGVRTLNLGVLGAASVKVNTFPSGHAAEALACALLLAGAPAAVLAIMALAALGVSAGAVLGRYHYLLDVVSGWMVAFGVWACLR